MRVLRRALTSWILVLALPTPAVRAAAFLSDAVREQARTHRAGTVDVVVTYRGRPGMFERGRAQAGGAELRGAYELVPAWPCVSP